jgi:hypothetical protein
MAEETTRQFINRRRKELTFQISALRGQLAPREQELADLNRMEAALTIAGGAPPPASTGLVDNLNPISGTSVSYVDAFQKFLEPAQLTIKDMILQALGNHFHAGATPSELSDYMKSAYGREVDRNSISPQLARLREEGLVQNTNALNESGRWKVSVRGSIVDAVNEVQEKNLNALSSSPRARRWYGPGLDPDKE